MHIRNHNKGTTLVNLNNNNNNKVQNILIIIIIYSVTDTQLNLFRQFAIEYNKRLQRLYFSSHKSI